TSLAPELMALPERPVFFSVATPQSTMLVVAARHGTKVVGARISPSAMQQLLAGLATQAVPASELAHFELKSVKRDSSEGPLCRLKTDFVSLVSHELRTPLTSIRMFIDTLAMGRVKNEGDHQQVLQMLSKETERLSAMIERVLDWARIEGGRKQYDVHPLP